MKTKSIGNGKSTKKVAKKPTKPTTPKADASIAKLTNRIKELEKLLEQANAEVQRLKDKYEPVKDDGKWEWDKKTVDYVECFERICSYMSDNTGFVPNLYENDEDYDENTEVDICLDFDGMEHSYWTNVRAFVGGAENEDSIFETIADLDKKYYKLNRWDSEFCNSCRPLGAVKIKDRSPVGIMKAMDKAGL